MTEHHESSPIVDSLTPEEAFELVAHETRFAILEALSDAEEALAFSDLRRSVGVRDPGQFNYHLDKLVGRFVHDGEAGYRISGAGRRLVGAVLSGRYTADIEADPVSMASGCLHCDGPMETRFHEDGVRMVCLDCGTDINDVAIPPAAIAGWSRERAPETVDRWIKRLRCVADLGFCHRCDGRVDRRLEPVGTDASSFLTDLDLDVVAVVECRRCDDRKVFAVGAVVSSHPAVVSFHYEHGIDVRETPFWDLDWLQTGIANVVEREPIRVEVPVTLDDETLHLTFDETLSVADERRTERRAE